MDNRTMDMVSPNSSQEQQQQYPPLVRQGSSLDSFRLGNNIDLNGSSSHKTINEVWREIVHPEHVYRSANNSLEQSILGETTMENFLARSMNPMVMASQPEEWSLPLQMPAINFQQQAHHQQHQHIRGLMSPDLSVYKSVYEGPVMDIGYSDNSMDISIPRVVATMSSTCSYSKEDDDDVKKKQRYSDEILEKTIERRQKRMAKNRESAARSRAKKQEYINELEEKEKRLRETNNLLKKMKEVDIWLSSSATTRTPKYQLRRTSSSTL